MTLPNICLIGDVVVDVSLKTPVNPIKVRLGGVIHAARSLWAQEVSFSVGYFAPAYLDKAILDYLSNLGCNNVIKLGDVTGAPNVFLIEEVKEAGNQGYDFLLREDLEVNYYDSNFDQLAAKDFTDFLFISGNYDYTRWLSQTTGRIHIDATNSMRDLASFEALERKFQTIFVSTSSELFKNHYGNAFSRFAVQFEEYAEVVILKENRGGSRGCELANTNVVAIAAQPRVIQHSVGVGDAYCAALVSNLDKTLGEAMTLASWIASEYAATTYPDDFKRNVKRITKVPLADLMNIAGVSLPWEERSNINIYIAAPDFDFVDTTFIDKMSESLSYHNFKPRRPVKENGQMPKDASKERKQEIFAKDMHILAECAILVAVLLYDDPGTLIEIGLAAAKGIPTIVYDPYNIASNCMLTELPTLVSNDLDHIITEVFTQAAKLK